MRAGCFDENRCGPCPLWFVNESARDEIADQVDSLVNRGHGIDGTKLDATSIVELCEGEARSNGSPEDIGIVAGAMVLINSGVCKEIRYEE